MTTTSATRRTDTAAVEIHGKLIPSPAAGQKWEMQAATLKLVGERGGDRLTRARVVALPAGIKMVFVLFSAV